MNCWKKRKLAFGKKCRKENALLCQKIVNEVGVTTEVISCSKQKSTNFCHPESKEVAEDKCMDQHERVAIVLAVSNQRISYIFRRQLYFLRSYPWKIKLKPKNIHPFYCL